MSISGTESASTMINGQTEGNLTNEVANVVQPISHAQAMPVPVNPEPVESMETNHAKESPERERSSDHKYAESSSEPKEEQRQQSGSPTEENPVRSSVEAVSENGAEGTDAGTEPDSERKSGTPVETEEGASVAGEPDMAEQVASIRTDLQYLTHQVYRILLSLHVPPCACATCIGRHSEQNEIILTSTRPHPHEVLEKDEEFMDTVQQGTSALLAASPMHPVSRAIEQDYDTDDSSEPSLAGPGDGLSMVTTQSSNVVAENKNPYDSLHIARSMQQMGGVSDFMREQRAKRGRRFGGPPGSGMRQRRAKYCTAEEKSAIAQYASEHGASAAARRYNVSPAVASYYHRKLFNRNLPKGRRPVADNSGQIEFNPATPTENSLNLLASAAVPQHQQRIAPRPPAGETPTDDGMMDSSQGSFSEGLAIAENVEVNQLNLSRESGFNTPDMKPLMSVYNSPTNNGGMYAGNLLIGKSASPKIRGLASAGKGRGRPRLIGDQLDAELIEHLASLIRDSRVHLNPERVLKIATSFIADRSPGLLAEEGGTVQLRQTWAAKTLNRVKESIRMERTAGLDQYVGNIVAAVKESTNAAMMRQPAASGVPTMVPVQRDLVIRNQLTGGTSIVPTQHLSSPMTVFTTTASNGIGGTKPTIVTNGQGKTTTHTLVLSPVNNPVVMNPGTNAGNATAQPVSYVSIAPKSIPTQQMAHQYPADEEPQSEPRAVDLRAKNRAP